MSRLRRRHPHDVLAGLSGLRNEFFLGGFGRLLLRGLLGGLRERRTGGQLRGKHRRKARRQNARERLRKRHAFLR
jgi:hypothetical protein